MSIALPKDLQKQNFYDAFKKMHSVPGWKIFEVNNVLALKSPVRLPFGKIVWGDATLENINKVLSFYSKYSFSWYLTQDQNDHYLLDAGFKELESMPEMILDLKSYTSISFLPKIKVIKVVSDNDFHIWAEIAAETFQCTMENIKNFFQPLVKIAGEIPYLAFYDNEPAATSLLYYDNKIAGIYAMSTREKFRRNGLGWAIAQACIEEAKKINIPYAGVYASKLGKLLYEKMGFQTVQILKKYFL